VDAIAVLVWVLISINTTSLLIYYSGMQGLNSMGFNTIPMTDEYAAHYFYQMGWMACRLAYKLEEEKNNE
jgi:hypothetical protein